MINKLLPALGLFLLVILSASFNDETDPFPMTAKTILQKMAKVNDDLYAGKYEVSNLEYRNYLNDLKIKNPGLAEKYRIDTAQWQTNNYGGPMSMYYHIHPAYNNYPVVNISYEAATAYCEWLTDRYNADDKRKFKKVRFYLPTEEEWMTVANGGNKNKIYPWGNYYLRNRTGQFLCNFNRIGPESITYDENTKQYRVVSEFQQRAAGGLNEQNGYTAAVNSFEATAPYSIHNMSGNVAEMVNEKGVAKGGCFKSPGYDVRIQSKMNYTDASPEVGFRVFMKIQHHD